MYDSETEGICTLVSTRIRGVCHKSYYPYINCDGFFQVEGRDESLCLEGNIKSPSRAVIVISLASCPLSTNQILTSEYRG